MWGVRAGVTFMSEALATVVAAIIAAIGTIGAVGIGGLLFRGKVKDIESALSQIESGLLAHKQSVQELLAELTEQTTASLQRLNDLRVGMDEQRNEGPAEDTPQGEETSPREQLIAQWHRVRDRIEALAAGPDIDGRTRAMYARQDRRSYWQLLEVMQERGHLKGHKADFDAALEIWMRFKANRATPTEKDIVSLRNLADLVVT